MRTLIVSETATWGASIELLTGGFDGLFGGVHLLPFFYPIDGADSGFDPIDHTRIDGAVSETGVTFGRLQRTRTSWRI